MENKFDVFKAALNLIRILLHCMLVTIMKRTPINLVCLYMTAICEARRVDMVNWHAC